MVLRRLIGLCLVASLVLGLGSVAQSGLIINNPSFETAPYPGGVGYGAIPGWSGSSGVNPSSTGASYFLNGLVPPDGTHVAFIQSTGLLTQSVSGFQQDQAYVLRYFLNERGISGAIAKPSAEIGGLVVVDPVDVKRTSTWRQMASHPFVATASGALTVGLRNVSTAGDNSALFDAVSIEPVRLAFYDPFTVSGNSNDVAYQNTIRQKGLLGSTPYRESGTTATGGTYDNYTQVGNTAAPSALYLESNYSDLRFNYVSPEPNFEWVPGTGEKLVIEVDIDPDVANSSSWAGITFGNSTRGNSVNSGDGIGLLIRPNGSFGLWDNTSTHRAEKGDGTALPAEIDRNDYYHVRFELEVPAFDDVSRATVTLFVDGIQVDRFVTDSGFADNYISLVGYNEYTTASTNPVNVIHAFDNLAVYATIPEPSSWLLLTGLLVLWPLRAIRRRIMRKARSSKMRPALLAELERRCLNSPG